MHHQEVARKLQPRNDFQLVLDLRVRPRRPLRRPYRLRAPAITRCRSQLSSVCPAGTSNGGSCGAISASPNAHCSPSSAAAVTTSGRCANSRAISSPTSGATRPAAPASRPPRPSSAGPGSHPSPSPAGPGTARRNAPRWWLSAHPEARRQVGQRGVALVVERMTVMGEFDADPVAAEPVNQGGQRLARRLWASSESAWRTCPLRQPVRMCQCPPAASVRVS